jgi:hypothetical protein
LCLTRQSFKFIRNFENGLKQSYPLVRKTMTSDVRMPYQQSRPSIERTHKQQSAIEAKYVQIPKAHLQVRNVKSHASCPRTVINTKQLRVKFVSLLNQKKKKSGTSCPCNQLPLGWKVPPKTSHANKLFETRDNVM